MSARISNLDVVHVRELGDGRTLRRPVIDDDQLSGEPAAFGGEFEHELVRVDGGEQTECHGRGSLSESVFTGVDLTATTLHPLTATDVRFEQVELSNAVLRDVVWRRVELVRCRAVGLRVDVRQLSDVYVEGCRFDYAALRIEQVKGPVAFRECTFREATIVGDLTGVVFVDCDFAAAEFDAVAAKGCDLRSSRLVGARGLLTLRGAQISPDQAVAVADQLAAEAGLRIGSDTAAG